MTNARLADFHPLPKGLARDRRYRRLSLAAARLLVDAHMTADETESDGLLDVAEFASLAALARIPASEVDGALAELVTAGFLALGAGDEYHITDFRGLSHEVRERHREAAREKKQRQRTAQPGYQMSPGDSPGVVPPAVPTPRGRGRDRGEKESPGGLQPPDPLCNPDDFVVEVS